MMQHIELVSSLVYVYTDSEGTEIKKSKPLTEEQMIENGYTFKTSYLFYKKEC